MWLPSARKMSIFDGFVRAFPLASALLAYLVLHRVYRIFYDLKRHPLAHIPGPKLAAITYLYQTYYSLVGGSRYYVKVGELHEKYGMIDVAQL